MTETEAILQKGPEVISAMLGAAGRPLSATVNWLGLAFAAADHALDAFESGQTAAGLEWSRCATGVYDALAIDFPDHRHGYERSSMCARVNAIRNAGPVSGDPVLDPSVVTKWFLTSLDQSLQSAVQQSRRFRAHLAGEKLDVEELRALRLIKNRLNVVVHLASTVEFEPELQEWLDVRDLLP